MSQLKPSSKEKRRCRVKDVEEIDRPRPTSTRSLLTLKPLPKIDPKDKGKKKIEEEDESESEDDDIPQAESFDSYVQIHKYEPDEFSELTNVNMERSSVGSSIVHPGYTFDATDEGLVRSHANRKDKYPTLKKGNTGANATTS
ncbi:hypothetical protein Tco_0644938 [Tanacetum coccineum]